MTPNSDTQSETPSPLRLDEQGVPILDEVVEDDDLDRLAAEIKEQLLAELQPQLRTLVRSVFTNAVKVVALELKRNFEQQLDQTLERRLRVLVEQAVERAFGPGPGAD
jgi:hypothetical protein